MKHCTALIAAMLVMTTLLVAGCARPRLAEQPLTEAQREWAESLRQYHPNWERPYMAPIRYRQAPAPRPATQRPRPVRGFHEPPDEFEPVPPDTGEFRQVADDFLLVPVDGGQDFEDTYQVRRGDTLSSIAADLYGDATAWRRIFEANSDILDSPEDLIPGMVLKVPARP